MYVFVDIGIDVHHLVETVRFNFAAGAQLALAGTIQFASSIQARFLGNPSCVASHPCAAVRCMVLDEDISIAA